MGKRKIGEEKSDSLEMADLVALKTDEPAEKAGMFFENFEWLKTHEAAIYLRKFSPDGVPSTNAIHKLVAKGAIKRRKFQGRLYFRRRELDYLLETSVS